MMYAPTPSADSGPRFCALDAVPRITLNNPTVRISSMTIAWTSVIPAPGSVAPSDPTLPNIAHSNSTARVEPSSSAMMYPGTRRHGKSPRRAKPRVTAGLRWAPLTAPMNRMIAMTMRPGAVTLAPPSDGAVAHGVDHATARAHQDQEERPEHLCEQPAPFVPRVIEVACDELELGQPPADPPRLSPDAASLTRGWLSHRRSPSSPCWGPSRVPFDAPTRPTLTGPPA